MSVPSWTRALLALGLAAGFMSPALAPALAQAPGFAPRDERVEDLPDGPGREETFGLCAACHAYRLVSNQGMTRERWDETMTWMTRRHGMPEVEGAERDLILDYLAKNHPPRTPARGGGFRNPFAPP